MNLSPEILAIKDFLESLGINPMLVMGAMAVVTAANVFTMLTPTRADNRLFDIALRLVNIAALNFGKNKNADDKPPTRIASRGTGRRGSLNSVLLLGVLLAVGACTTFETAETMGQKAYSLYGTFVVSEEAAADIVENASTPEQVRSAIQKADAIAKPAADALLAAYSAYNLYQTQVDGLTQAGQEVPPTLVDKADAALAALTTAYARAREPIGDLVRMIYSSGDEV